MCKRLDATQVTDLQNIQARIQDYSVSHNALPQTLADLGQPTLPTAPEKRAAYQYNIVDNGFELCATFAQVSTEPQMGYTMPVGVDGTIKNPDNWQHGAGKTCFKRVLTPSTPTNQPIAVPTQVKQ
jgi:hypothetical protein